jgi:hypothetical protein
MTLTLVAYQMEESNHSSLIMFEPVEFSNQFIDYLNFDTFEDACWAKKVWEDFINDNN